MPEIVRLRSILRKKSSLALAVGFVFSCGFSSLIYQRINEHKIIENKDRLFKIKQDIQLAFDQYLHPLEGNMSVYHALDLNVTADKFRKIAESRDLFKNFTGALGFGFIRKVPHLEVSNYLYQQTLNRPHFKLKRIEPKYDRGESADLYVIELVEPVEINEKAAINPIKYL